MGLEEILTGEDKDKFVSLQLQKLEAELQKTQNEARRWGYEAEKSGKDLEAWNASADEHRIYHFFGQVDGGNVAACMDVIGNWTRRSADPIDLKIIFNSPGGSVIHGLALFDFFDELKGSGHHITTVNRGMAASMGGILLQAGHERVVGTNSHMLIHEVSSIGMGKMSELEDELKFIKRLQDRCLTILAERSTLTKKQIDAKWRRKDWWLNASECVEYGFADRIG